MDRAVIDWLIENNIFEAVMTATRGPDDADPELKRWLTAPLRWAIGFHYGSAGPPCTIALDIISAENPISGLPKFSTRTTRFGHFLEHAWGAFRVLRKAGYELSRVPLWVYLAVDITQEIYGRELLKRILETMDARNNLDFRGLLAQTKPGLTLNYAPFRRIDL